MSFPAQLSNGDGSFVDVVVQSLSTQAGLVPVTLGNTPAPPPPPMPPDAPLQVKATAASTTAIDLSWADANLPAGATPVTGYTVSTSTGTVVATLAVVNAYQVTGLSPATSYSYVVRAVNSVGTSAASLAATAQTLSTPTQNSAPAAPTNFAAAAVSSTQVNLSWNAALLPTGATSVTGYRVYNGTTGALIKTLGVVLSTSITGLSPSTTYTYAVTAVNAAGEGNKSTVRSVTTPTVGAKGRPIIGRLIGVWNGGTSTDDAFKTSFGKYPEIATSYNQLTGNASLKVANETTRINKGIIPLLPNSTADTQNVSQLANSDPTILAAVDALAVKLNQLGNVNPNQPILTTLDVEPEVKANQGALTGDSAIPARYGQAMNVFVSRLRSQLTAKNVFIGLWFGGYDKAAILEILQNLDTDIGLDWLSYDPYTTETGGASSRPSTVWPGNANWFRNGTSTGAGDPTPRGAGAAEYKRIGSPPLCLTEFAVDGRLGDATLEGYYTNLRQAMKDLDLMFAVLFNRNKTDRDGQVVQYQLNTGAFPRGVAAFKASLASTIAG